MNARLTTVLARGHEISGLCGGKEDTVAEEILPHVFLIGLKPTKKVHLFHEVLLPWCLDASLWFKCQIFIQLYKDVSVENELFRVKHVTLEQQLCTLSLSLSFIL